MYGIFDVSTSALTTYRTQMEVAAGNIAMKDAYHEENGEFVPFRRRVALIAEGDPSGAPGVHVARIAGDPTPFALREDPSSPYAITQGPDKGKVRATNVDYHTEMINAMTAARAYEANVTVIEMAKSMAASSLRLIA